MSSEPPRTVHQMASYAAYHLSEQATGGRQWTEAQVEENLRTLYPRADQSDIDLALHYGRESVHAAESFRDEPEGLTLSEVTGIPEEQEVVVYFRLRWGEGGAAQYRIFPVRTTGGASLALTGEVAEELAESMGGGEDYPLGEATDIQLFKVDFFGD